MPNLFIFPRKKIGRICQIPPMTGYFGTPSNSKPPSWHITHRYLPISGKKISIRMGRNFPHMAVFFTSGIARNSVRHTRTYLSPTKYVIYKNSNFSSEKHHCKHHPLTIYPQNMFACSFNFAQEPPTGAIRLG